MGLARAFTRQRPQPPGQTRAITEFAVIDGVAVDGSGEIGNRWRGAMTVPAVWRAANLVADLLGSIPWCAYRQRAGRPVELLDPTPPLLEQPSPPESRVNTMSSLALDLLLNGNAVEIIAARSRDGWPTATYPVPAEQVGVRRVTENMYSPLPVGSIEYSIGGLSFAPSELIHTKGPCAPGALRGMGIVEHHLTGGAIGLAKEQMRQAQGLANHGVPTGFLKDDNPDTTTEELAANKAAWLASQRDRTVAMLNANLSFTPLSWNPEELQLIEARRFSLHEVALIFGLPLSFLGADQSSDTYRNSQEEALDLLKFSLAGHLARFEQARTLAFPRGTYVKATLDAILRADTKSRYEAHSIGLAAGFLTVNEVRELEDRPPILDPDDGYEEQVRSQSDLDNTPNGRKLWDYWTKGEGLAKWAKSTHPYTALTRALLKAGVPVRSVHGLAANMFHAVFGFWPGEREGDNPVGPG